MDAGANVLNFPNIMFFNYKYKRQHKDFSSPHFAPPTIKERMLQAIIMHHIYGTLVAYYSLYNGSTLFTVPNYSAESMLQAIPQLKVSCLQASFVQMDDFQISHIHLVPPMVATLANALVDNSALSSLKSLTCAAAPLDPAIAELCKQRLNLTDFRQRTHVSNQARP